MLDVIRVMVEEEVEVQNKSETLFRGNSLITQVMSTFSKEVGTGYVQKMLDPVLTYLITACNEGLNYEVDPLKFGKDHVKQIQSNNTNLESLIKKLMNSIIQSLEICPPSIRFACKTLRESISNKFPEAKYIVIAGFYFLRFVCPAVLNPSWNTDLSPTVRRALILATKVLQSAANSATALREEYLSVFSPLTKELGNKMNDFFDKLVDFDGDLEETDYNNLEAYEDSLKSLHVFISKNLKPFTSNCIKVIEEEEEDDEHLWDLLVELNLLAQLPISVPDDHKFKGAKPKKQRNLYGFMMSGNRSKRNSEKTTKKITIERRKRFQNAGVRPNLDTLSNSSDQSNPQPSGSITTGSASPSTSISIDKLALIRSQVGGLARKRSKSLLAPAISLPWETAKANAEQETKEPDKIS
eukprot:TRINITY_DN862_c0_g1_i3.p1 TRINITY_DN862_c0_g1~~TRINITY_DN862_c0_g1_i3.p1  ORF type:complete len:412 (+),score=67.35 TRINITY_DN862_c0_g1_i3:589-1824(+)